MVSLLKLARITEEGVRFLSPHDGSPMYDFPWTHSNSRLTLLARLLTPEHSMSLQNSIGSDIMMQLDDVIQTTSPDHARMKEAMERSVRWLDRCIAAHKYPEKQNLFCIIQGGLDLDLRKQCCEEMIKRDTPGIAIGGLSGGEAKSDFCKVSVYRAKDVFVPSNDLSRVDTCTDLLPEEKPRYVMGIACTPAERLHRSTLTFNQGYPEDIVVAVALGADMFDCVWPTRTAVSHAVY